MVIHPMVKMRTRRFQNVNRRDISIPGIKPLLNSQTNIFKRFAWLAMFVACVGAVIYQLIDRISYYLSEPTTINVIIEERESVLLPSVSICPIFVTSIVLRNMVAEYLAHKESSANQTDQWCPKLTFRFETHDEFDDVDMNHFWQLYSMNKSGISADVEYHYFKELAIMVMDIPLSVTETAVPWGKCLTLTAEKAVLINGQTTVQFYVDLVELLPIFKEFVHCPVDWYQPEKFAFSFAINGIDSPQYYGDGIYDFNRFYAGQEALFHLDSKQFFRKSTQRRPCEEDWKPPYLAHERCMRDKILQRNFPCSTPLTSSIENLTCENPITFLDVSLAMLGDVVVNRTYYEECTEKRLRLCYETKFTAVEYKSAQNLSENFTSVLRLVIWNRFFESIHEEYIYDLSALISDIGGSMGVFLGICVLTLVEIFDIIVSELALKLRNCTCKK